MFPEGTRQSGPIVQPLFEGAAYVATRTGVPIVPVGIGGSERAMPKGSKMIRPVKIHIVVGRPREPDRAAEGGKRALTRRRPRAHRAAAHRDAEAVRPGPGGPGRAWRGLEAGGAKTLRTSGSKCSSGSVS